MLQNWCYENNRRDLNEEKKNSVIDMVWSIFVIICVSHSDAS